MVNSDKVWKVCSLCKLAVIDIGVLEEDYFSASLLDAVC